MGYCIDLTEYDFKIKKENADKVLKVLQVYMKTHERPMWVTPKNVIEANNIQDAFEEIRYSLITDENGDYILNDFYGEKLGDDKDILNSIAQYVVPDSFIEFEGEDGDDLRLEFDGKECNEKWC